MQEQERGFVLNIEPYNVESLRKIVRFLEEENKALKEKLKEANILYEDIDPFCETIDNSISFDYDQGARIILGTRRCFC